ncbi:cupin domain-containing protein [Hydrogenophaga sp. A37]|uniref:cupin domain-containing protein n=1 Tax=Hydrogenophaga sp. A37 TaxID=1945864 RepID=UPI000986678A|nr:cupin domain-containing protein [Hydrogenophaga sp. A37]OOG83998.1 enzyme of the cupin superfamily [Hydrogenophaga sp. A37]
MSNLQHAAAMLANPPSFVDLRQFARDKNQGIAVVTAAGEDRFLSSRRVLDWAPGGPVTAGVIALEAGQGSVSSLPADEFILVTEGSLTLSQPGATLTLAPGQSAVIQQGAAFAWSAQGPVSLIFTRYNHSQPGTGAIVPIQAGPELKPSGTPSLDLLTTPMPSCRNFTDYVSADGEFMCGTWDSTPYARRPLFYRHYELMYLLEGSVDFVDETGRSGTFAEGDIFLVEQGASCTWDSRENVTKVYVIYRPK